MGPALSFVVYLTLWWVVFLAILPLGTTSYAEAGVDKGDGGDPGAPLNPNIKRKLVTTTWVALIPFVVIWFTVYFHLIALPNLGAGAPGS
jgi:predicted secreted protein